MRETLFGLFIDAQTMALLEFLRNTWTEKIAKNKNTMNLRCCKEKSYSMID